MRKIQNQEIRKLAKRGNSISVTIPIELIRELKWKEKQKVVVKRTRGGVTIKDWRS